MLHACFVTILICFMCTFPHILAFSGTNLLTQCRSATSCFLLFLCFKKVVNESFSELVETKDRSLIFSGRRWSQKDTRRRAATWQYIGQERPHPWPRLAHVLTPRRLVCSSLPPIYSSYRENPRDESLHPRKVPKPPSTETLVREGSAVHPGTLPEREITAGGLYIAMSSSEVMRE